VYIAVLGFVVTNVLAEMAHLSDPGTITKENLPDSVLQLKARALAVGDDLLTSCSPIQSLYESAKLVRFVKLFEFAVLSHAMLVV
jgi:hypothetical protein